jgi:hypothetical protein
MKTKEQVLWDLNLFYKEDYNVETDETTWEDVITINPSIYEIDEHGGTMHHFTDIIIKTTFAEARYISSVRPIEKYGSDWFEFCDEFMEVAPPRIKSLLQALPDANEYFEGLAS